MAQWARLLVLGLLIIGTLGAQNFAKNPGLSSTADWDCYSCKAALSDDSHSGSHSLLITSRYTIQNGGQSWNTKVNCFASIKENRVVLLFSGNMIGHWAGPSQTASLQPDKTYYFRFWVKFLNNVNGKMYHQIDTTLDILDNDGKHKYVACGVSPYLLPGVWHVVGGDYYIPANTKTVRFGVKSKDKELNFLIDDVEVDWIDHSPSFIADTDRDIDKYRKSDLTLKVVAPKSLTGLKVELQQTTSEFGWGSAVNERDIVGDHKPKYKEFFYDLFEWAVLETGLKWTALEPKQGHVDYSRALKAVDYMISRGIKVRGHNIFWGGDNVVPSWQKAMNPVQLKQAMEEHVKELTQTFKGRFQHYDVENENLHLHFYEEKLNDPNITQWMFRETHKYDPHTKCFLNEYDIVAGYMTTAAYEDQAIQFKKQGVPVEGMGIQSHLRGYIDIAVIKRRLEEAANAHLPIWITELDIEETDEHEKAKKYEDVLRLYFSHPAVNGVMFWGFWDGHHWRKDAAMANGPNVTPNAAGRKIQELLKKTWRTNESHDFSGHDIKTRAFKGSYKVLVHRNGKVIHTQNTNLSKDSAVTLDLNHLGIVG